VKDSRPTAMVCPLDWGLGHASRMIPVVRMLMKKGYKIKLAGSGKSLALLSCNFPGLPFISMPSAEIRYSESKSQLWCIISQLPALLLSIVKEHRLICKLVRENSVDLIVSDNRYGLYCKNTYTVLVTHQLSPVLPYPVKFLEYPVHVIIKHFIRKFNACWVPDAKGRDNNLSGILSHRYSIPSNVHYIGILSRFLGLNIAIPNKSLLNFEIVAVISGPNPQAEIFMQKIIQNSEVLKRKTLIIGGLNKYRNQDVFHHVTIISHLPTNQFFYVLINAKLIICRSGYSGIMDLICLGKNALLVPTPGQTEQEYLAKSLAEKYSFFYCRQDKLNYAIIEKVLNSMKNKPVYFRNTFNSDLFISNNHLQLP